MEQVKSPWPIAIVIFFLVVFTVNGSFLYIALKNRPGVTTTSPYEDGLLYQREYDAKVLAMQDFKHSLSGRCVNGEKCFLRVRLEVIGANPLPPSVNVAVQQVGIGTKKVQGVAKPKGRGVYDYLSDSLTAGHWLVQVSFLLNKRAYRFEDTVRVSL